MNIDLLMTEQGEPGLVCDGRFESAVMGVLFDAQTRALSIEFDDLTSFDTNIPVEETMAGHLLYAMAMQIGIIENGEIQDNRRVPLMLLNDPEGAPGRDAPVRPSRSVLAFENFLKRCVVAQPIHRDDLGDEATMDGVMSGLNKAVLQFAPHLARQRVMEISPHLAPQGPSAPGLGPGGRASLPTVRQRQPRKDEGGEE